MATWKLATIGLTNRDYALIETAIDLAYGLESGRWQIVDSADFAQVAIVNTDDPEGLTVLANPAPGLLIVPCNVTDENYDTNELALAAPVSYKSVTSLLKILETRLANPEKWAREHKTPTVAESPVAETPVAETPVVESPVVESPVVESPVVESPVVESPVAKASPGKSKSSAKKTSTPVIEEIDSYTIERHKIDWLSDATEEHEAIHDNSPVLTDVTVPELRFVRPEIVEEAHETEQYRTEYDPATRLAGLIENIIDHGKTSLISHPDYPEIRIFPENGWFVFTDELDSHPQMYRSDASEFSVEFLEEEIKDELFSGRLPQSLWKLIFTAALFGSEGRLLKSLNIDDEFHLLHTPYFGMIPHTSEHVSIADYMVNNSNTAGAIAAELNIDTATVIDFCNACASIQLLKRGAENLHETHAVNEEFRTNLEQIENETTVESEIDRSAKYKKKSGILNSLWSNLHKST